MNKSELLKRRRRLDTQKKGKYVHQIIIGIDPTTGNLQITTPNGMPLPTILGFIEVAKVLLCKPLTAEQPNVLPASADALERLKNGSR